MATEWDERRQTRLRRAGEMLSSDSSLRDNLDDDQANALLSWAMRKLEEEVDKTLDLPWDEAQPLVEARLDALRDVMARTNRMTGELPAASQARSREHLMQFVDALCEVDARTVHVDDMLALQEMADARAELDGGAIFQRLLTTIEHEDDGSEQMA